MHGSSKKRVLEKKFVEFHGSRSLVFLAFAVWFFFHKGISAGFSIFLRPNVSESGRLSLTFKHFKALVSQFKKLEFLWLTKKIACLNSQTLPLTLYVRCFVAKLKVITRDMPAATQVNAIKVKLKKL